MSSENDTSDRLSTGIEGLDTILEGGLPRNRLYLIQGDPGVGKTTLALQFLLAGVRAGEPGLYVTLSETKEELSAVARSHGWDLEGITLFEIQAGEEHLKVDEQYSVFHPSEIELGQTVQALLDEVERTHPRRVVIDSLSEMRLLARDPLRYRRQILALKQFFVTRDCTVLVVDDPVKRLGEHQFQTLAHGVISLERFSPEFGPSHRRLEVVKLRGVRYHDGYHDYAVQTGGIVVYPRLVASRHRRQFAPEKVVSGVTELDGLLGGGPERGTSLLIIGPAGSGKSTIATQYARAAASRGERCAIYTFDESTDTLFARTDGLGMPLREHVGSGKIAIQQIDPAALSPGEFFSAVCREVEQNNARVVVIDSLNGYLNAMPEERFLLIQMHELLTYLGQQGVLTIVIVAQHGLVASNGETPIDVSYLADTVLLLRYFEYGGRVRKAVSVLKKRSGRHEEAVREFRLGPGLRVGAALEEFQGVLSGVATYSGSAAMLKEDNGHDRR